MFRITRPKLIICDAACVPTIREALSNIDSATVESVILYTVDERLAGVKSVEDLLLPSDTPLEEKLFVCTDVGDGTQHPVAIVCSSGSTGLAKRVIVPHALLMHQITSLT